MKLDFFRDLYDKGLFSLYESFDNWQDAIKASVEPLVRNGYVEREYGDAILRHVEEYGLYIFIAPHFCMPHCKAFEYVNKSGMSIMKVNKPVCPDPGSKDTFAELFVALAGKNEDEHLDAIQSLMELLDDEESFEALLNAKTAEDFERLAHQ